VPKSDAKMYWLVFLAVMSGSSSSSDSSSSKLLMSQDKSCTSLLHPKVVH
jgi:hypothetical protein